MTWTISYYHPKLGAMPKPNDEVFESFEEGLEALHEDAESWAEGQTITWVEPTRYAVSSKKDPLKLSMYALIEKDKDA